VTEAVAKAFGLTLSKLLSQRGMKQSDLAWNMWGETRVDARGYKTVVGRDRVSSWCAGKSYPDPHNRELIAKTLSIAVESLFPSTAPDRGSFTFKGNGSCHVKIDQMLPADKARRIMLVMTEN
jgi:hypothetical protein